MEFTPTCRHTNCLAVSPDSQYTACAENGHVTVRHLQSCQTAHQWQLKDVVMQLQFSPDSKHLLVSCHPAAPKLQVFSLEHGTHSVRISDNTMGIVHCQWAPDGDSLLTITQHHTRCNIYHLKSRTVTSIKYPKLGSLLLSQPAGSGNSSMNDAAHGTTEQARCTFTSPYEWRTVRYSPDGKYLAVLQRNTAEYRDCIALYDTDSYSCIQSIQCVSTMNDAALIVWSPDSQYIAAVDQVLNYRVHVYTLDGKCQLDYSAYSDQLGIKLPSSTSSASSVVFSPDSRLLAVGSYDECVRIWNTLTWEYVGELRHQLDAHASLSNPQVCVYSEVRSKEEANHSGDQTSDIDALNTTQQSILNTSTTRALFKSKPAFNRKASTATATNEPTRYDVIDFPCRIQCVEPDIDADSPKQGICAIEWSSDSTLIAIRNENMPNTVWVWDATRFQLSAVLNQVQPVRSLVFEPLSQRCVFSCGNAKLYVFTADGSSIVDLPTTGLSVRQVQYTADGHSLLLADKSKFTLCSFNDAAEQAGQDENQPPGED